MANNYSQFSCVFPFPKEAYEDFVMIQQAAANATGMMDETPEVPAWWVRVLDPSIPENEAEKVAKEWTEDCSLFLDKLEDAGVNSASCEHEYDDASGTMSVWTEGEGASAYDIAVLLSHAMARHDVRDVITMEESWWCDKARPDNFGGQAIAVGPGVVRAEGTTFIKNRLAKELREELGIPERQPSEGSSGPRP